MTDRDGIESRDHSGEEVARSANPGLDVKKQSVLRRARSLEAAAIAGIVFAVMAIAALLLLSRFPSLDRSDEEITAWFDDSTNQATLLIGLNLVAVSSVSFLWFLAVIRRRLGDLEDRFFGTVFLGAGLSYVAIWLIAGAALAGPAVATNVLGSGAVTNASASPGAGIGVGLLLVIGPRLQSVFMISTSTVILRSGILPHWLGIVGYLMALPMFLLPLITQPLGLGFQSGCSS